MIMVNNDGQCYTRAFYTSFVATHLGHLTGRYLCPIRNSLQLPYKLLFCTHTYWNLDL